MTELVPFTLQDQLPANGLRAWRSEFEAAASIASSLSLTEFIPESLKVRNAEGVLQPNATAATIAAALLTGQELGLGPMSSLRSIDVVNGTPALRAVAMRGLVLAAGHDMWVESASDVRAIVCGQRRGSEHVQRCEWDEDRARKLNLWDKPGWRKQRRNMLIARATSECARLTAPERILGLGYSAEELSDNGTGVDEPVEPEAIEAPKRRARRKTTPPKAKVDEPEVRQAPAKPMDEPPLDDDEPPPPDTAGMLKALHAAFTELGVTDRDAKLAMLAGILDRQVDSSTDLSPSEYSAAIDALTKLRREGPSDDAAQPPTRLHRNDQGAGDDGAN